MNNVYVKFECGMEDRESKEYGPFEWVQLTYETLRIPVPDDVANELAYYDQERNEWWITNPEYRSWAGMAEYGDPEDAKQWWSDVIIYTKEVQG